jgi:hypothetical protein
LSNLVAYEADIKSFIYALARPDDKTPVFDQAWYDQYRERIVATWIEGKQALCKSVGQKLNYTLGVMEPRMFNDARRAIKWAYVLHAHQNKRGPACDPRSNCNFDKEVERAILGACRRVFHMDNKPLLQAPHCFHAARDEQQRKDCIEFVTEFHVLSRGEKPSVPPRPKTVQFDVHEQSERVQQQHHVFRPAIRES